LKRDFFFPVVPRFDEAALPSRGRDRFVDREKVQEKLSSIGQSFDDVMPHGAALLMSIHTDFARFFCRPRLANFFMDENGIFSGDNRCGALG
jgi:hypothetical protein